MRRARRVRRDGSASRVVGWFRSPEIDGVRPRSGSDRHEDERSAEKTDILQDVIEFVLSFFLRDSPEIVEEDRAHDEENCECPGGQNRIHPEDDPDTPEDEDGARQKNECGRPCTPRTASGPRGPRSGCSRCTRRGSVRGARTRPRTPSLGAPRVLNASGNDARCVLTSLIRVTTRTARYDHLSIINWCE